MSKQAYTELLALLGIGGAHPGGLELTKDILTEMDLNNKTVLEVGCGTGQTSAYLCSHGAKLTTIDNHPLMVEKANKRFLERQLPCTALKMSIEETLLVPSTFDYVLAESVLTFTNIKKSIPEVYRLLKRNGSLICIEMTKKETLPKSLETKMKQVYGIPKILTKEEWDKTFSSFGFREINHNSIALSNIEPSEPELDPSHDIGEEYFSILRKHEELTLETGSHIELSIIKAKK
ncbi:class I SAM-dependent methyltransferase [Sutcliffiella deserti]|uniref:class I SAM-dependent methyltransferase n=1 Tax=Sutcliffiella deserti TaxID=2875501 RepID=UPI001CBF09D7|nr:class I SAM-dependent methyltransferase [Sutcliffiella deserti]